MTTVQQEFQRKLTDLINAHSAENDSNTPDHILAEYMMGCLAAFNRATTNRDQWYDIDPWKDANQP